MQCRDDSFMTMAICSDFYNETYIHFTYHIILSFTGKNHSSACPKSTF